MDGSESNLEIIRMNEMPTNYEYVFYFQESRSLHKKVTNKIRPSTAEKVGDERNKLVAALENVGLLVEEKRVQGNDLYLLVGATTQRLEQEAEKMELPMKLKDEYGGGYDEFRIRSKSKFVQHDVDHFFSSLQRQHIIKTIMQNEIIDGGADLDLEKLQSSGTVTKIYPIHEKSKQKLLSANLKRSITKGPSLAPLRAYFGEQIAIYFAFLSFYTKWLALPSIFGIICFIVSFWDPIQMTNSIYAIFMAVWATVVLQYWKRRNSALIYKWNMQNFVERDELRPSFEGVDRLGYVYNGVWIPWEQEQYGIPPKVTRYYSTIRRKFKEAISYVPITTLGIVVVIATLAILTFRLFVQKSSFSVLGGFIGGVLNAIAIVILNKIYRTIAVYLTDWENHRTQTDYENRLVIKIFLFQFVNSYTSLFYVGFFKRNALLWGSAALEDDCRQGNPEAHTTGCIDELTIQLATIMAVNMFIGQAQEVLLPWLLGKLKRRKKPVDIPQYEEEMKMNKYSGTLDEYAEMAIQFGYLNLFAAAFPLAPIMALINNMIEIRTDAFKVIHETNRPHYRGASGIGVWYIIFEFLGILGVITNCMLIGFAYGTIFHFIQNVGVVFMIVILLEHILLSLKFSIAYIIPDIPYYVRRADAIQNFVKENQFKKLEEVKILNSDARLQDEESKM